MLLAAVAFAAAQVSGPAVATPAASPAPAQATATKPQKKKRHIEECTGTEPETGSNLIPCNPPTDDERDMIDKKGAGMLRFSTPAPATSPR